MKNKFFVLLTAFVLLQVACSEAGEAPTTIENQKHIPAGDPIYVLPAEKQAKPDQTEAFIALIDSVSDARDKNFPKTVQGAIDVFNIDVTYLGGEIAKYNLSRAINIHAQYLHGSTWTTNTLVLIKSEIDRQNALNAPWEKAEPLFVARQIIVDETPLFWAEDYDKDFQKRTKALAPKVAKHYKNEELNFCDLMGILRDDCPVQLFKGARFHLFHNAAKSAALDQIGITTNWDPINIDAQILKHSCGGTSQTDVLIAYKKGSELQ